MPNKIISTPENAAANPTAQTVAPDTQRNGQPPEETLSPAPLRVALGLFLFGSCIAFIVTFFLYSRQAGIDPVIDLNGFGKLGRHIAAGDGFNLGWGPTLRRAPLYPALVGLVLHFTGYVGPDRIVYRPVQFLQCLVFGLTCVTSWALARKLFGDRVGVVAGILCALTPQALRYVPMTEVETLMTLLITLTALTGLNLACKPTLANGALFGLVVGIASLVKAVEELFPIVLGLLICWQWFAARRRSQAKTSLTRSPLPALATTAVVMALIMTPWIIRNSIVSHGEFHGVSSNAGGEFFRGYILVQPKYLFLQHNFGGWGPDGAAWVWEADHAEDRMLRKHGMSFFSTQFGDKMPMEARIDLELKKEKIENAEMKRLLTQEPLGFIKKFVAQLFTYWYMVETKTKSVIAGLISLFVLSLAAVGFVQARRNHILVYPVVAIVIYYNCLYAAFLSLARYAMPVFPTLLTLSAYGLVTLWPKRAPAGASKVHSGA